MNEQETLQTILAQLCKARALAAVAELKALNEREGAEGSEVAEKRERYEYIIGRFSGLNEAVSIVNGILNPNGR